MTTPRLAPGATPRCLPVPMDKLRILALLALCSGFSAVRAEEPLTLTLEQALRLTDSATSPCSSAAKPRPRRPRWRISNAPGCCRLSACTRCRGGPRRKHRQQYGGAEPSGQQLLRQAYGQLRGAQPAAIFRLAGRAHRCGGGRPRCEGHASIHAGDGVESYFAHLRNLRRIVVLDANIERAQKLLTLAQNLFNGGVATQIDVTRADALVAQAQLARLQHQTTVVASELLLKRLLDLDLRQPLDLKDFVVRRVAAGEYVFGRERTTFELRADYLRAQKAVEQAKLDLRTARFERLPVFSVTANTAMPRWNSATAPRKPPGPPLPP